MSKFCIICLKISKCLISINIDVENFKFYFFILNRLRSIDFEINTNFEALKKIFEIDYDPSISKIRY